MFICFVDYMMSTIEETGYPPKKRAMSAKKVSIQKGAGIVPEKNKQSNKKGDLHQQSWKRNSQTIAQATYLDQPLARNPTQYSFTQDPHSQLTNNQDQVATQSGPLCLDSGSSGNIFMYGQYC